MSKQKHSSHFLEILGLRMVACTVLGFIMLGIAGCCGETALERDFGYSWAYNEEVQIANPQADLNETPATGLPPNASATVMNGYNKSFERTKSGSGGTTMINLGGLTTAPGSGGGGGDSSGGGNQ